MVSLVGLEPTRYLSSTSPSNLLVYHFRHNDIKVGAECYLLPLESEVVNRLRTEKL